MNFKAGDIVTIEGDHEDVVFRIHSIRWDDYYGPWGKCNKGKRWLANGVHIGKSYHGTWMNQFHLELCVLHNPICRFKRLKKFNMTK